MTGGASGLGAAVVEQLLDRGDAVAVLDRARRRCGARPVTSRSTSPTRARPRQAVGGGTRSHWAASTPSSRPRGSTSAAPFGDVSRASVGAGDRRQPPRHAWPWCAPRCPTSARPRGRVVLVASTLGWRALPDATAYCASKFGVVGFARALAAECRGRPGVTCLLPGGHGDGRSSTAAPSSTSPVPMPS